MSSCILKDIASEEQKRQTEVSFAFLEPADVKLPAETNGVDEYDPWKEYAKCLTGFDEETGQPLPFEIDVEDLLVHVIVKTEALDATSQEKEDWLKIIKKRDGSWITDKKGDNVYYAGVKANTIFAPYVGQILPQPLFVNSFEKTTVDVWVLCVRTRFK